MTERGGSGQPAAPTGSPPWGLGVAAGLVVAAVDTLARLYLAQGISETAREVVGIANLFVSVGAFYFVALQTLRRTGHARSSAEVAALTGAIVGVIDAGVALLVPIADDPERVQLVVGLVSQNIFMAGIVGLGVGVLAEPRRPRPPERRQ